MECFFIFKRFSPFSHPPQPPASRRKRLKAAPEKAPFQPSVLSADVYKRQELFRSHESCYQFNLFILKQNKYDGKSNPNDRHADKGMEKRAVSYTHLDVYKRQLYKYRQQKVADISLPLRLRCGNN